MKNLKFAFFITTFLFAASVISSCSGGTSDAKQGKEYTSAYICPMHCKDSGSETAGKCPVCGMDYVANEKVESKEESHEGHDHGGESHEGHSH